MAQQHNHFARKVATLEVRSAFNSARWPDMLAALEEVLGVPNYLLRMIKSYLREGELRFNAADGPFNKEITGEVAQRYI